jgi:hypothetical protein
MKRASFRLASVHRVRRLQHDIEQARLAGARVAASQARDREAQRFDVYRTVLADRFGDAVPPQSTDELLGERDRLDLLAEGVIVAGDMIRDADVVVADRAIDWRFARQRVAALDRLLEHHADAVQSERLAEDVRESDERTEQRRHRTASHVAAGLLATERLATDRLATDRLATQSAAAHHARAFPVEAETP